VADLKFSQSERRSFLVPILLALGALALAIALAILFFPATTVDIAHVHTDVVPTETFLKNGTVVGAGEMDRVLFVASKVKIDNKLRTQLYLDDFHMTFTDARGAEVDVHAIGERDFGEMETNYPALKPLLTTPLARNAVLDPNTSAEGTILFSLNMSKETWDARQSAVIKVDLYHRPPVYVTIPK
jgi:hypothetical protein